MDPQIKQILELSLPEMPEAIRLCDAGDTKGLRDLLVQKAEALGEVLRLLDRQIAPGSGASRRSLAW